MANRWIKVYSTLATDPKVLAMSKALGVPRREVLGAVLIFWTHADIHADPKGFIAWLTPEMIDAETGLSGFAAEMQRKDWMEVTPEGVTVPHFSRHFSPEEKQRASTARRVAKHRSKAKNPGNNEDVTHGRYKSVTREEKNRDRSEGENTHRESADADVVCDSPAEAVDCRKAADEEPEGFAAFWQLWPETHLKKGAAKCRRLWKQESLESDAVEILRALEAWIVSDQWARGVLHAPYTWLHDSMWKLPCPPAVGAGSAALRTKPNAAARHLALADNVMKA